MDFIEHTIRDPRRRVTYLVCAHRKLERPEIVALVQRYQSTHKAPPKDSTVRMFDTEAGQ